MLDLLTNTGWLNPQIDFLVFLQNIRMAHSEIINHFFLTITIFGEIWLPTLICAIVYWCFSSKNGIYMFLLFGFNALISHFLKLIAGVYRPWILSDKVKPFEKALYHARSYSFPSGHAGSSASVLGGLAYILRRYKILIILLIILILLIGFSRLWLGVHTPQDVIVGFTIGLILVFAGNFIINWAEKNKNNYLYLLGAVDIIAAIALVYVSYIHHYQIDYIDGKVLVDPYHAVHTSVMFYGYVLGLMNGAFICRRFFPFEVNSVSIKTRIIRGFIGTIGLLSVVNGLVQHLFDSNYSNKISIILMFICGLLLTAGYPFIFSKVEQYFCRKNKTN